MPLLRLAKTGFRFNALHAFGDAGDYDSNLHGHDYELTVMVEGERGEGAMLYDLRELKPLVQREILARLDHTDLGAILPNPTLEALAEWIWRQLRPAVPARLRLGLQLWETRSIYLEFWGT